MFNDAFGQAAMMNESPIHRHLDPGDSLGEALFGLIMALTATLGARLAAADGPLNVHQLIVTIIGCNIAWGVIDAVFFLLGGLFHRSRRARFYRSLRSSDNDVEAMAALEEEFGLQDEPLTVGIEDRTSLYRAMLAVSTHAAPARPRLLPRDFLAAFVVFLLVSAAALPAVMPFRVGLTIMLMGIAMVSIAIALGG